MWSSTQRKTDPALTRLIARTSDAVTNTQPISRHVTLISGQSSESPSATNCTITGDTVNFKVGARAHKMTMSGAVTAQLILDPVGPGPDDPIQFGPASAVGIWVYTTTPAAVTSLTVEVYSNSGLSVSWSRNMPTYKALSSGWTMIRAPASDGTLTGWGTAYRVRVVCGVNAACDVTIGQVWAEVPAKAQMIMVADGPYKSFMTGIYPDMKARGIPVTFSCDPAILGSGSGVTERMSWSDIDAVAIDGNQNSIGIHGYDGATTSSMTTTQIVADTVNAIKLLKQRDYFSGCLWRSAWVQNLATNHAAAQPFLLAYATPTAVSGSIGCWPPHDKWNMRRYVIHGRTNGDFDTVFTQLQNTRGLIIPYTHGLDAGGGTNITPAEYAYFLSKVDAAMSAGWLEGVTFEQLFARHGGTFESVEGVHYAVWTDADGARQRLALL